MPSIFTLEGPHLGYAQATPVAHPAGVLRGTDSAGGFLKGVVGLFLVGLLGRWAYRRYKHTGHLFGLGGDMLDTIKAESRSRAEYARRAEAWNAGNALPLSVRELAKRYRRGNTAETERLIRAARRAREEGRGELWKRLATGLKGLGGLKARRAASFRDDGLYEVVDDSGAVITRLFRSPDDREWYEEGLPGTRQHHYTERWRGSTQAEALARIEKRGPLKGLAGLGAITKKPVEKVRVGDVIGAPGDRKVRTIWLTVDKIEKSGKIITFISKDNGIWIARRGETLKVR